MKGQERYHGLDFVRAMAMLLGLVLHVCIFFMPTGNYMWVAGEYSGDPVNRGLLSFIHYFRMELFFLMAGFFAELVIFRKGFASLIKDRIKRILVPFVFAVLFMVPLHFYVTNVNGFYSATLDGLGFLERYKALFLWGVFEDKPIYDTPDSLAHYWFIHYLVLIYILHFVMRPMVDLILGNQAINRFWRFCIECRYGVFLLALTCLPLQYSLKDIFFPPSGYDVPLLDLAFYGLFYFAGVLLFKTRGLLSHLSQNAWFYFLTSIPFFLFLDLPTQNFNYGASVMSDISSWRVSNFNYVHEGLFHGGWSKLLIAYGRALTCWLMCFAFIGLAHRYLNKANATIRYLADSAYWVYWIHMPLTFGLSKVGQQVESVNSLTKSYLILLVSTLMIYWSYNTFVRYTFLGDFFMGARKKRDSKGESDFTIAKLTLRVFPKTMIVLPFVFFIGCMFEFNNSFKRGDILVEAYVARKAETLERVESIEGITDQNGESPLHTAARRLEKNRRYNPMPVLIGKAKDVNPVNSVGRTPLFIAVRTGNLGDIQRLLKAGAHLGIADRYGHTPAHVAAIKAGIKEQKASDHYYDILKLLQEKGADLSLKDDRGRTVEDCLKQFANRSLD
jgi:glucan biosynthesis protein C